jgi:alpha-methylacyl-CoA racemase
VYAIDEVARDEHLNARRAFSGATHGEHGSFRQTGDVLAGMVRPEGAAAAREAGRTDTDALLGEAGMPAAEIAALREQGIIA